MPIHVTDDPDVFVSKSQLQRYEEQYRNAFMFFAGTPPTLAEFIRRKQSRKNAFSPAT